MFYFIQVSDDRTDVDTVCDVLLYFSAILRYYCYDIFTFVLSIYIILYTYVIRRRKQIVDSDQCDDT